MSIQSSINKILGTAAGVAVGAKAFQEKKLREQLASAKSDAEKAELEKQLKESQESLKIAQKDLEKRIHKDYQNRALKGWKTRKAKEDAKTNLDLLKDAREEQLGPNSEFRFRLGKHPLMDGPER